MAAEEEKNNVQPEEAVPEETASEECTECPETACSENEDQADDASKEEETTREKKLEEKWKKKLETAENLSKLELEKANAETRKAREQLTRLAAEYENFRKRSEREKEAIHADATASAVTELLSVADNLERALAQKDCSVEDLRRGVEMVMNQLQAAFRKLDVTEMGQVGDPFDPNLHNAISHVEDENAEENTIVQVFEKGYRIGDKVIRHAMVQVAN